LALCRALCEETAQVLDVVPPGLAQGIRHDAAGSHPGLRRASISPGWSDIGCGAAWRPGWQTGGEPVPVITGDVQGVIIMLAQGAAGALAGRLGNVGASDEGAQSMALGFVEDRLSRLLLDERLWMPDDPPLPLEEPNEQ
jgi:hypothetical protein